MCFVMGYFRSSLAIALASCSVIRRLPAMISPFSGTAIELPFSSFNWLPFSSFAQSEPAVTSPQMPPRVPEIFSAVMLPEKVWQP